MQKGHLLHFMAWDFCRASSISANTIKSNKGNKYEIYFHLKFLFKLSRNTVSFKGYTLWALGLQILKTRVHLVYILCVYQMDNLKRSSANCSLSACSYFSERKTPLLCVFAIQFDLFMNRGKYLNNVNLPQAEIDKYIPSQQHVQSTF